MEVLRRLEKEHPTAPQVALDHSTPLQLLISTILSAQCTDERVNKVTKTLFKKYPTAEDYSRANIKELEQDVRSTGFYRNKAKNIRAAAALIESEYGGKVPDTMEELLLLPGVARKTANIVLTGAYGKVEGIAVDTHVKRLAQRTGLTKSDDPKKIEVDLMGLYPKKEWPKINKLLVAHGRKTCQARKPQCPICAICEICPKNGVKTGQKRL
jgi:endonuclease-3